MAKAIVAMVGESILRSVMMSLRFCTFTVAVEMDSRAAISWFFFPSMAKRNISR